uniref:Uncharacterized protein n=1 Tax=Plectus sambesii TaxID=2011161 RepID=A0A914WKI5_9BILA
MASSLPPPPLGHQLPTMAAGVGRGRDETREERVDGAVRVSRHLLRRLVDRGVGGAERAEGFAFVLPSRRRSSSSSLSLRVERTASTYLTWVCANAIRLARGCRRRGGSSNMYLNMSDIAVLIASESGQGWGGGGGVGGRRDAASSPKMTSCSRGNRQSTETIRSTVGRRG